MNKVKPLTFMIRGFFDDYFSEDVFLKTFFTMFDPKNTKAPKVRSVIPRDTKPISGAIVRIKSASIFITKTTFLNFSLKLIVHIYISIYV